MKGGLLAAALSVGLYLALVAGMRSGPAEPNPTLSDEQRQQILFVIENWDGERIRIDDAYFAGWVLERRTPVPGADVNARTRAVAEPIAQRLSFLIERPEPCKAPCRRASDSPREHWAAITAACDKVPTTGFAGGGSTDRSLAYVQLETEVLDFCDAVRAKRHLAPGTSEPDLAFAIEWYHRISGALLRAPVVTR